MLQAKAFRLAQSIVNGFDAFFADYLNLTLGAHVRFEKASWLEVHQAQQDRLVLYEKKVREVVELARYTVGDTLHDALLWAEVKKQFIPLIKDHRNVEVVESFFNSIYCYVFQHKVIRDTHAFAQHSTAPVATGINPNIYRSYQPTQDLGSLLVEILYDCGFSVPFENLARDTDYVIDAIQTNLIAKLPGDINFTDVEVQVCKSLFFRNKGAYIVGRVLIEKVVVPFVMPVLHAENGGLFIDTVLFERSDISIVFSFTRTYFMLYTDQPSQYVAFLKTVMPNKEVFELYTAIGFPKHAKTEFVRRSVTRIAESNDQFITAPGIKGMVMLVFTLPSYEYVFKVIRDRFTPPKDLTREQVKSKYRLVKLHERAGRMADSQEFDNLVFDRERFSEELMEELHSEIASQLEEKANVLCIKHCYVERRMHPLNLYLRNRSKSEIRNVMGEYGNSIKQLAAANIFPGDMLLKNFGVTRHGRVVFYDYDEVCLLTECNFRKIPEPRTEEQEMADIPWYSVAPNDVFPEEFRLFFSGNAQAREIFEELHSDLYDYQYWQNLQTNIQAGCVADVYPYRRSKRFADA